MSRAHIFMTAGPGQEGSVQEWFRGVKGDFDNECGIELASQPSLLPLLGPYDFVLEVQCSNMDDIGLVVGWVRNQLKKWVVKTVTVVERGDISRGHAGGGEGSRVIVCIVSAPQSQADVEGLEKLLSEHAKGKRLDAVRLFGEYDYMVGFDAADLNGAGAVVQGLREKLGSKIVQTVTLMEWKMPRSGSGS